MISKLKIKKANGNNDIMPFYLKISANIIAHPLSAILNQCIAFGYFANKLKISKVIPVYKAGPTNQPGNYRLISLLPSMSKIFVCLILNRLIYFFQRNKILIPTQFGFRHNHSTLYPILDMMTECYDNIHPKRFSTLLFLAIKTAFDSVCHKKLLKKLNFYGIRGVANTFISLYLRNRKQFVCINNDFSTFKSIEWCIDFQKH